MTASIPHVWVGGGDLGPVDTDAYDLDDYTPHDALADANHHAWWTPTVELRWPDGTVQEAEYDIDEHGSGCSNWGSRR